MRELMVFSPKELIFSHSRTTHPRRAKLTSRETLPSLGWDCSSHRANHENCGMVHWMPDRAAEMHSWLHGHSPQCSKTLVFFSNRPLHVHMEQKQLETWAGMQLAFLRSLTHAYTWVACWRRILQATASGTVLTKSAVVKKEGLFAVTRVDLFRSAFQNRLDSRPIMRGWPKLEYLLVIIKLDLYKWNNILKFIAVGFQFLDRRGHQ